MPKKGGALPRSVSNDVVERYVKDGIGGPSLSAMELDWSLSLTESWNKDAIILLSKDFKDVLVTGKKYEYVKYNERRVTLQSIIRSCRSKLLRIQRIIWSSTSESKKHPSLSSYEKWKLRQYSR